MTLDAFFRRCLAQGLEYHRAEGRGLLPGGLVEEIRALDQPPRPWDVELARWFDEHFASLERRRSFARASRHSSTPDIPRPMWVPAAREDDGRTFGVVLDTSGSVDRKLLAKALGALGSALGGFRRVAQLISSYSAVVLDGGTWTTYTLAAPGSAPQFVLGPDDDEIVIAASDQQLQALVSDQTVELGSTLPDGTFYYQAATAATGPTLAAALQLGDELEVARWPDPAAVAKIRPTTRRTPRSPAPSFPGPSRAGFSFIDPLRPETSRISSVMGLGRKSRRLRSSNGPDRRMVRRCGMFAAWSALSGRPESSLRRPGRSSQHVMA